MKKLLILPFLILILCITAIPVSAFSSSLSRNYFSCIIQNAPDDAVYVDILIELTPRDKEYAEFNNRETAVPADSEIAFYNNDGYMSLSFHYKNLDKASMEISSPWFHLNDSDLSMNKVSPTIKVVLLDKAGNILHISDEINIKPAKSKFAYSLTYDVIQNTAKVEFDDLHKNSFIFLYLLIPIRIAFAAGIGTLIAIPLKLRPLWKVPVVTVASQIVYIVILLIFLFSGIFHLPLLIIGEIFVYIGEFVAYIFVYQKSPKWKFAVNTLAANTTSFFIVIMIITIKALIQMSNMT